MVVHQCSSKRMRGCWGGGLWDGDLEAAEHGEEGLGNDSTKEQIAERGHCQPTGARLQGLNLGGVEPPQWTPRPAVRPTVTNLNEALP